MEKPDAEYWSNSFPQIAIQKGYHDTEHDNSTALTARQKLNPQPTDDPNDPVSDFLKAP